MKRGAVWYTSVTTLGVGAILVVLWLGKSYIFAPAGYDRGVALVKHLKSFSKMSPGEVMRAAGDSNYNGTSMLLVLEQNSNSYNVTYFGVPSDICRYAIDASFTSNIITRVYVNSYKIPFNTGGGQHYNYTQITDIAFSKKQDSIAEQYCGPGQTQGKDDIRFDIVLHELNFSP